MGVQRADMNLLLLLLAVSICVSDCARVVRMDKREEMMLKRGDDEAPGIAQQAEQMIDVLIKDG